MMFSRFKQLGPLFVHCHSDLLTHLAHGWKAFTPSKGPAGIDDGDGVSEITLLSLCWDH